MAYKGKFAPKNPSKYNGNPQNIIYRSNWELRVMKYLDENPQVIWWSSEELSIPYISPVDLKTHRYFPDFIFKVKNKNNEVSTHMWEVKPYRQTQEPKIKRKTKQALQEAMTYAVNQAKFNAAQIFCTENGWKFSVITEKELGI